MGMSGGGGRRAVPFINVTPLIDVLLVLLIIFMVVTPFKPKRFKTLIPTQQQGPPPPGEASKLTLRVDITKEGKLLLNNEDRNQAGEPYGSVDDTHSNTAVLSKRIADELEYRDTHKGIDVYKDPQSMIVEKTVYVKAPESFKYGNVVKVIDAVKAAGADPVGLQVDALDK